MNVDRIYSGSSVLVTGGAGFLGSHLVERLVSLNADVKILDNFSTGRDDNLNNVSARVKIVKGDIREKTVVESAVDGCSIVFHLAAIPSVGVSIDDPSGTNQVNLSASSQLFKACGELGINNVVFASTSAVYGVPERLPVTEDHHTRPVSPYGIQKLASEHYGFVFSQIHGYRFVALRFFNIYGPRQDSKNPHAAVIPRFVEALSNSRAPIIFGDGLQTRDFVYVSDAVDALVLAGVSKTSGFFNVASGDSSSVMELVELLRELLGGPAPVHTSERVGDIKHSWADISLARRHLDYSPSHNLEAGLKLYVEWVRLRGYPVHTCL